MRRSGATARGLAAVTALLLGMALAGCGASVATPGDETSAGGHHRAAPELSSVTAAPDPRSLKGPSTAVVGGDVVHPVETDPTPQLPVTVTDVQGTKVTVKDDSRILALDIYGTLSRTVFELGLGSHVVGRDISTEFAEARKLPLVTHDGHDLNAEAILELNPTVVLTDTSLGPWDVILQLRDAGIPVVVTDSHRGLDNVTELTEQVADALGVHQAGVELAQRTEQQISAVRAQIAAVAPQATDDRLRTLFLYVRGQAGVYYMFGEGSGADSLIDALGGYDVAKEIGWKGMKPVTDEGIIAAQPDVILMMTDGLSSTGGVDGLLKRLPALANTPAGQHRRIVDMADSEILGFGPETAPVLNALAVALYAPAALK